MTKITKSAILLLFAIFLFNGNSAAQKNRKESFFGLHFDFHASYEDDEIGKNLSKGMIDSLLVIAKPDYIQVDCKGHPGYSSYPTQVGSQTGGYVRDPLKMIREVSSSHEVAMYVHYSGVWDRKAIEIHPEWARLDAKGNPDINETSRHSNYVDSLMLPQLKELARDYKVDGAWIDGECWGTNLDYSPAAIKDFQKQTGIDPVPRSSADTGYYEWKEFTRKKFRDHMAYYVDAMHQFSPGFQITSNWAYTGFMPEPVTTNIDFISGDLAAQSSVYSAAFEARCIAHQGKPWDLMGWSFAFNRKTRFRSPKSTIQICQEAAQVLAMGGGFQLYYNQNRDASFQTWAYPSMQEISEFCRERKAYCFQNTQIPQVALLYSSVSFKKDGERIYSYSDGIADELKGTLMMLMDQQYSVDIVMEHHLKGDMKKYPVIVIPGWGSLADEFKSELLEYSKNGGSLVLIGPSTLTLFEDELGIDINNTIPDEAFYLAYQGEMGMLRSPRVEVKPNKDAVLTGGLSKIADFRSPLIPAASVQNYGKGKIALIFTNLGQNYITQRISLASDFLDEVVQQVFPDPVVSIEGSGFVHVNVNRNQNNTYVHIMNTAGEHDNANVGQIDKIPPLYDLSLGLILPEKPRKIILQPENNALDFHWKDGKAFMKISKLEIYSIIEVIN